MSPGHEPVNGPLQECDVACPYCGEIVTLLIDPSVSGAQSYIEDCQVCCRPMVIELPQGPGGDVGTPQVRRDDD